MKASFPFPCIQAPALASVLCGQSRTQQKQRFLERAVSVTNMGTNATRLDASNEGGMYSFPVLLPALYTVRVEASGFGAQAQSLELEVQQTALVDFALLLGTSKQAFEVTGQAELLNTGDATVAARNRLVVLVEEPLGGATSGTDTCPYPHQ